MRSIAFLSAGSNLGDRAAHLLGGIASLREAGVLVHRVSPVYETEPVGFREQPWFLNMALQVETDLSPLALLAGCLEIEKAHGRAHSAQGAARTLDLDILLMGDLIMHVPELQIPHPRMALRRFVLEPLAQIAPEAFHPVLKTTIQCLLSVCPDSSVVKRASNLNWQFRHLD